MWHKGIYNRLYLPRLNPDTGNLIVTMNNEIFICHNCPMTRTMATIGTKWKPIIIYTIAKRSVRFGFIHAAMGIISRKVLTEQLKELEEDGIISRKEFEASVQRVEYILTEKGLDLLPILNMLTRWNKKYHPFEKPVKK